jgi:hypothetical protein
MMLHGKTIFALLCAASVAFASLPSAFARRPLDPGVLVGQYEMSGADPMRLILSRNGKFIMAMNLGHDVKVRGTWRLDGTQVILCIRRGYLTMKNTRVFGWLLQARWHGASFDLVPKETLDRYEEDPSNVGTCFRRSDVAIQ